MVPISDSHEAESSTPAQKCALYDFGGGVALRNLDSFAIYSVVALPPSLGVIIRGLKICEELCEATRGIAALLPIFTSLHETPCDFVSLPCPPRRQPRSTTKSRPRHDPPWFLANAAKYSKHCILGRSSDLETILLVLQRPWCVLELCCCDTPVVAAVYRFAVIASRIDHAIYHPAVKLLSHEMKSRELQVQKCMVFSTALDVSQQGPTWNPMSEASLIYGDLSSVRLRSHKSFWLGLICTSVAYLDVAPSGLAWVLAGELYYDTLAISDLDVKDAILQNHWRSISTEAKNDLTRLFQSHIGLGKGPATSQGRPNPNFLKMDSGNPDPAKERAAILKNLCFDSRHQLFDLYIAILKGIEESLL